MERRWQRQRLSLTSTRSRKPPGEQAMTALATPRPRHAGQKLVLCNIAWDTYRQLGDALKDRNIYLTYDRGVLEIMVISAEHERYKGLFALLVFTLARYYRRKIGVFGSFTHQRQDLLRG